MESKYKYLDNLVIDIRAERVNISGDIKALSQYVLTTSCDNAMYLTVDNLRTNQRDIPEIDNNLLIELLERTIRNIKGPDKSEPTIESLVKEYPNDQDLGQAIRSLITKTE